MHTAPEPTRPGTLRCRRIAAFALGCLLSRGAVAEAQTASEIATRRLLLDRAEAARTGGQHAEALELYLRAGQIQMTPSVRAFIAEEQLRTGRLAEAMGSADLCLRELGAATAVRNQAAIESHCRGLRDNLRQRVGELVVEVPTPAPAGLRVTVGGSELTAVLYGQPAVTTPGSVEVVAAVGGVERWRRSVTVVARETATVRVELPPEAPVAPVVEPPVVVPVVVTPPPVVVRPAVAVDRGRTRRTIGWGLLGGAAAGVAIGTVGLIMQRVRAGDFAGQYVESTCDADAACRNERSAIEAAGAAAWGGYVAGAALGAAGLAVVLTAPSAPTRATGLRGCGPGPGTVGVSCGFAF